MLSRKCPVIFAIFLVISFPALGLEFELHANESETLRAVMATGDVLWNDAERLDAFLSRLPEKKHTAIYLNSPGGSLSGGVSLGTYFNQRRIKTVVEGYEVCASACALAFLGGTDRHGHRWMSSTTRSLLGVHAFSNADGTKYDHTDDLQQVVAEILDYGRRVRAPTEILIRGFQTPSDRMYWFNNSELLRMGVKVWDIERKCFLQDENC